MRKSRYSFILRKGFCCFIYNCKTDAVSVIDNHLAELIEDSEIDLIEQKHPDFYKFLIKEGFVVDDKVDESLSVIEEWKAEESSSTFSIFINPTMDCNLRCWYCYEKHLADSIMSKDVSQAIMKFLNNEIKEKNIRAIGISFFGGEPLLALSDVVVPLLWSISEVTKGLIVNVSFVTNGILLTETNIVKLKSIPICDNFTCQVTLDGNKEFHDKTKHFQDGSGSYSVILQNVKDALRMGLHIVLRFNTTEKNLMSFADVLSDLEHIPAEHKENLEIDFQHVWQDNVANNMQYIEKQEAIRDVYVKLGFKVRELKHIDNSRCYADRKNHYVVNYNGDVYKCTAQEFSVENRDGILTSDGRVKWNARNQHREAIKYGNDSCRECNIFPICHGGCSRFKMDSMSTNGCLRGYSHKDKEKIVNDRVDYIINNLNS